MCYQIKEPITLQVLGQGLHDLVEKRSIREAHVPILIACCLNCQGQVLKYTCNYIERLKVVPLLPGLALPLQK